MTERQFNTNVKMVRSDNALELGWGIIISDFFTSTWIIHQISCTATLQQNGIVKRKYRHLLETSRALLHQPKLRISY